MLKRIFNSETKSIKWATAILAVSALVSALLGLYRDRLLAGFFGAGVETSVYFAAFRIPDLIYKVLILGGVLVAFLPIFAEYFAEKKEKAWEMTNQVLNIFSFLLILSCLILFIFTPQLIKFIIPGLSLESKSEAVSLSRLLFLSPIFFGISNIFSGVLHYFNRFLTYSLAPVLYNVGIVLGILFLSPSLGIFGAGVGVIIGAFFHLAIQIPSALNCGFRYRFIFNFKYPALKRIFKLALPRVFSVAAYQVNLIVMTSFASLISTGSIAIFSFAQNLQGLPTGILGISLATAIFPTFSRYLANGQKKEFLNTFSSVLRQSLFLMVPLTLFFFLLRNQIVGLILGVGRFNLEDSQLTTVSLGFFAISIFALSLIPYLTRAFFSLQDTKTPALLTLIFVALNLSLSFFFIKSLGSANLLSTAVRNVFNLGDIANISVVGLPMAFSVSSIVQFFLLLIFLHRKIGDYGHIDILRSFSKVILSSFFMGLVIYFILLLAATWSLFWQAAVATAAGLATFALSAFFLRSKELKEIWKIFAIS
jgi:putative peptidoglycan lipid II flippase